MVTEGMRAAGTCTRRGIYTKIELRVTGFSFHGLPEFYCINQNFRGYVRRHKPVSRRERIFSPEALDLGNNPTLAHGSHTVGVTLPPD